MVRFGIVPSRDSHWHYVLQDLTTLTTYRRRARILYTRTHSLDTTRISPWFSMWLAPTAAASPRNCLGAGLHCTLPLAIWFPRLRSENLADVWRGVFAHVRFACCSLDWRTYWRWLRGQIRGISDFRLEKHELSSVLHFIHVWVTILPIVELVHFGFDILCLARNKLTSSRTSNAWHRRNMIARLRNLGAETLSRIYFILTGYLFFNKTCTLKGGF